MHAQASRSALRTFCVSGLGTALEFYDFIIYGTAAALVFPQVFFPGLDHLTATLVAFSAFGAGFLARPLGGLVFGHFGDRVGRQKVLVTTLLLMGLSTFLIGCLPGHASLGVAAPILLVLLRLVQGFAAGGEWGGAALFGIESAPPGRRGLWGSFTSMGIGVGGILGAAVFALVSAAFDDNLVSLEVLLDEWSRTDADYATRLAHLDGTLAGGLNGSLVLDATTVAEDGVADEVWGEAGEDWFVLAGGSNPDLASDPELAEIVTRLG